MNVREIIPGLWLGDKNISLNRQFYIDNDIDIVINCSKELPFIDIDIDKIRIKVDDNLEKTEIINMYNNFEYIVKYINDNLNLCKNILVHCYAGRQRSATIIVSYLLKYSKMNLEKVISLIKYKKEDIFYPKINFIEALKIYTKDI